VAPLRPPDDEAEVVQRVTTRLRGFEESLGTRFRNRCDELRRQYRGFREWQQDWIRSPNDRDAWVPEAKKRWGADLHIPMSFRAVETAIPRMFANPPRLLYLPRDETQDASGMEGAEAVQILIDWQQEAITIELPFQSVGRDGLMFGLGVGKTGWDRQVRRRTRMMPLEVPTDQATHGLQAVEEVCFDGPRFWDIDVGDFMWDPYGYDMDNVDWTAHRVWLTLDAVASRLASGRWHTQTAAQMLPENASELENSNQLYDEAWAERLRERGSSISHGEPIHELIEYHDGEQVFAVLDRKYLVVNGENGCGEMPFQVFRPIPLKHEMIGVGLLEPLEHLQREFDTLRSARRDATTLSLRAPIAYDDTAVDAEDIVYSPTGLIGVDGDPRAVLQQLAPKEVPGTSYQEEQSVRGDIADIAGLSEGAEGGMPANTATEAQLVQSAVSLRMEMAARRFELEVVEPVARMFLYLNQREIRQAQTLAVPVPEPDPDAAPYKHVRIGPAELAGEVTIKAVAGSMAARNIPQDRADATQIFNQLAGDWFTNPTKVREKYYELMGFKHPKAWLRSPEPSVPLMALRFLVQGGVDPALIAQAMNRAREVSAPEEGAEQVAPMSGAQQQ
jgi:hypothetical protein